MSLPVVSVTEDRWTPPSEWCPAPHWWHSDPDSADPAEHEVTALMVALIRAAQPEVVVETGTSTGQTAVAIGRALKENGHGRLWTVEIDDRLARAAEQAAGDLPVTVVHADSLAWDPPEAIDFAWIDSGPAHVRVQEIRQWQSRFRRGAIIGVHDTAPDYGREVLREALFTFLAEAGWAVLTLRTPRGVTLAQVT